MQELSERLSGKEESLNSKFMNIHERIRKARKDSALTILELSTLTGIPGRTISNYERADRNPSVEYITILAEKLGVNPSWLLLGQGQAFINKEEKGNQFPEGKTADDFIFIPVLENIDKRDYIAFPKNLVFKEISSANEPVLIKNNSDSMNPTIKQGDTLIIDKSVKKLQIEGIYAFNINESISTKRFQLLPDKKAKLINDNTHYPSYIIDLNDESINIIGSVIWFGRLIERF